MATVFMMDPATARCALYDEPVASGAFNDPNSARNAPLNNSASNLAYIYYHSDYDPMEVVFLQSSIAISHALIPAGSAPGVPGAATDFQQYGSYIADQLLFTHNLGYVPDFFLASGQNIIHPGYPVQYDSASGRARCVTAYATTTQIRLWEFGIQTANSLPAINLNYNLLILSQPPAASGNILFDFNGTTGLVTMAKGKFSSDRKYLQIIGGGTPFGLPLGRTIDLANGTFRSVAPDGSIRDVVPATFRVSFGSGTPTFGPDGNYNGSFTGDGSILVQAP